MFTNINYRYLHVGRDAWFSPTCQHHTDKYSSQDFKFLHILIHVLIWRFLVSSTLPSASNPGLITRIPKGFLSGKETAKELQNIIDHDGRHSPSRSNGNETI